MTQKSYLRHFNAQVSQIVFLAYLTALKAYYNYISWNLRKLVSPWFQCRSITNRVLSFFDRFAVLLQLYDLKCQKTHLCAISVHKYHKSCS